MVGDLCTQPLVIRPALEVHTRIIIADGLTNEFLSQEVQFRHRPENLGTHEIARIMGAGARFGTGPLPAFLDRIRESADPAQSTALLVMRDLDDEASPDGFGAGSADFVEPFHDSVKGAAIVPCTRGAGYRHARPQVHGLQNCYG